MSNATSSIGKVLLNLCANLSSCYSDIYLERMGAPSLWPSIDCHRRQSMDHRILIDVLLTSCSNFKRDFVKMTSLEDHVYHSIFSEAIKTTASGWKSWKLTYTIYYTWNQVGGSLFLISNQQKTALFPFCCFHII